MSYKIEFPDYDDELPVIDGFSDTSWHNDSCPSLTKYINKSTENFIVIFCDYKDVLRREFGNDAKRFSVYINHFDFSFFESENFNEVICFVNDFMETK